MLVLLLAPNYKPVDEAITSILEEDKDATAISRDLIIGAKLSLIYKGQAVGFLISDDGQYLFEPTSRRDPMAKRAAFKLQKEGILCL